MRTRPTQVLHSPVPIEAPWRCVSEVGSTQVALEVRRVDDDTFALRQSSQLTWEAPIMFLLLGTERTLLLDTGAVADAARCPLRETVAEVVRRWAAERGIDEPELVVAHSHGHNDHTAGDAQFDGQPRTTVVPKDLDAVRACFGLPSEGDGGDGVVPFDLGGRELLVTLTPGHDEPSITVLDPSRGLMLTGDLVYPGRLYVKDLEATRKSLARLVALAEEHRIRHVLGCHVERDARGADLPSLVRFHRDEQCWVLGPEDLRAVHEAAEAAPGPGVHHADPMSLHVGACVGPMLALATRGLARRATRRG